MTVCIAIACQSIEPPRIILITDHEVTTGSSSSDTMPKIRMLCPGWAAMFSGDDIRMVDIIVMECQAQLRGAPGQRVAEAMRVSYQGIRRKQIQDWHLSHYNWDMDKFLQLGLASLGETHHDRILAAIEGFDLECEFLVSGLTEAHHMSDSATTRTAPVLFKVRNPGVFTELAPGYAAIGSGESAAVAYLDSRRQGPHLSYVECLYNGIAAKTLAERANGVGERTTVAVLSPGGAPILIEEKAVEAIKDMWRKEEFDVRPVRLKERVSEILKA